MEKILTRLLPRTSGFEPRLLGGSTPELSKADISLLVSAAPRMSFHALMAKYCDDQLSLQKVLEWTQNRSLREWFFNPKNRNASIVVSQVNALVELAVMAWVAPQIAENAGVVSRAAYVGTTKDTWRRRYADHFALLISELDGLETEGLSAMRRFRD